MCSSTGTGLTDPAISLEATWPSVRLVTADVLPCSRAKDVEPDINAPVSDRKLLRSTTRGFIRVDAQSV